MQRRSGLAIVLAGLAAFTLAVDAQSPTPPPAPTLFAPPSGAALVQPITLRWSAVSDPDGPIGSYTWQLGTTSSFTSIVASGFRDLSDGDPTPTEARLSGVPNGSYFWRVRASQLVGGATGSIDSPWSAVRSITITGLGPAPAGTPQFTAPANGSRFHPYEFFTIRWTEVPGAHYYLLEADDEPSFSFPHPLTTGPMKFGTTFAAGWGNEIPNIYYRVRAVSADNVIGLPSPALNVKIVNTAPVPPPPTPLLPSANATVSLPFEFDWSDTANPQIPGYDIDVDDDPAFDGVFGVLMVQNISRSDYVLMTDLAPGDYFWRIRAQHGNVYGPWSSGVPFRVVAAPPTPPGLDLAWFVTQPGTVYGGRSTQGRVVLSAPAPAGGAVVRIASDLPHTEVPDSVFIPAGQTDAVVSPITSVPVIGATIGSMRAGYGGGWEQSSIGMWPIVFSLALNTDWVIGSNPVTGTITLQQPAPAGGVEVTLVSEDTSLVRPPAKVMIPEGASGATFAIQTSVVSTATRVVIHTGTFGDGYQAPEAWLTVKPAGSAASAPTLAGVSLRSTTIVSGGTTSGTVTLNAPAPAGGASVWVNGSMEGQVVTSPLGGVTVPAGSRTADFSITAPPVNVSQWVMIQASYGSGANGMHGALLQIDPAPGTPEVFAIGIDPMSVTSGQTVRGTVGLVQPAPPGGATIFLSSSDPAAQVPSSVNIAAGNSANSFTITTSSVINATSANIVGSTAGSNTTKDTWLTIFPNPNADVVLLSVSPSVSGTTGGNSIPATLFLNGNSPPGGAVVTLTSSNTAAAQVPASVSIPGGQGWANFTITTSPVAAETSVTITGNYRATQSTVITVLPGPKNTGLRSATANAPDSGGDGNGFETSPGNAHGDDTANAVDTDSGTVSSTSCTSTGRDRHRYFNYGLALSSDATINGIEVRLDSRVDNTSGSPRMCVELSWNGGVSWTAPLASPTLSTSMASRTLGGAANTWGRSWTPADLSNANFRVRVTAVANSTVRDFTLDWIAVRVTYQGGSSEPPPPPPPDTTPPSAAITSPTGGASVSGTTAIAATASDNVGVTRVDFFVDGALLSSDTSAPYSASWNTTSATNAAHSLTARAFDAAGNQATSAAVSVTVNNTAPPPDTTPPSVSIASPTGGASVSGTTTIAASAADNVGVTRVDFFVDGVLLSSDTSSPYSASWNTTSATNASHSLTARAFDAAGNQTPSGAVSVTVNNTAPPPGTATLTVTATGRSGERVTSNPAGINVSVGTTGSASYNTGTSITLSATNGRDTIWSGACSSGGSKVKTCTFTLNANATVTANVQ
jgi:hypothetical protein